MGIEKELYVLIRDLTDRKLIQLLSKYGKAAKSSWANYRLLHDHRSISNGRGRLCPLLHTYTHILPVLQTAYTHQHTSRSAI